jgi:formate--tetrahydrofolate ligase
MAALLRDAIRPNLAQTVEGAPALVHAGPFANIAHGCNSALATRLALKLGDFAISEAGFGADLGAEKFFDIKCRLAGLKPSAAVLVVSCRALRFHGLEGDGWTGPNLEAARRGLEHVRVHLENLAKFGVPAMVALNHFDGDPEDEIEAARTFAEGMGAPFAVSDVARLGGQGGEDMARALMKLTEERPSDFRPLYPLEAPLREKVEAIAREIYRADGVDWDEAAEKSLAALESGGMARAPVCMAKTPLSFSDDPKRRGVPRGWRLRVRDLYASRGAGFVVALAGAIVQMPGMGETGAFERIGVDASGEVTGLR